MFGISIPYQDDARDLPRLRMDSQTEGLGPWTRNGPRKPAFQGNTAVYDNACISEKKRQPPGHTGKGECSTGTLGHQVAARLIVLLPARASARALPPPALATSFRPAPSGLFEELDVLSEATRAMQCYRQSGGVQNNLPEGYEPLSSPNKTALSTWMSLCRR